MKKITRLITFSAVFIGIAQPLLAQNDRIGIMPPIMPPIEPPFPPRIEIIFPNNVRPPDIGPMEIREMGISAKINGLYAEVETTLVFHNPNARQLEGDLIFPLPDGAAVSGYALDIHGAMVDGVIVPKERARVAFETETRRNVDPGLVEHVKGNLYRTRIFPLPANGERRIRLKYLTPLTTAQNGDAALLLGIPREKIAKLDVEVEVSTHADVRPEIGGLGDKRFEQAEHIWRVKSSSTDSKPGEDVIVALPKLPASFHQIQRDAEGKNWFMLSTVPAPRKTDSILSNLVHIVWDASGSRAGADLSKEFELLKKCQANSYKLTVFRDVVEPTGDFKTIDELIAAIKAEPFDGGSDFSALASTLKKNPIDAANSYTLLFSDGFDTLSGQALAFDGLSVIAVVSQMVADSESLRQACAGALIDLKAVDGDSAWKQITTPTPRVIGLRGTGIAQVQGIGQSASARIKLLGQLTADEASVQIAYADGTFSEAFILRAADAKEGKVLATAWASARVSQLSPRADQMEDELLSLGRTYGLVSPATSLIVLESLDQWVRHEIEPPASLPEMRNQWQSAMKSMPKNNGLTETQRIEQLVALWEARVSWWKTDFSKGKPNLSGRSDGVPRAMTRRGNDSGDGFAAQESAGFSGRAPSAPSSATRSNALAAPQEEERLTGMSAIKEVNGQAAPSSSIAIKPWDPSTPYLKAISAADPEKRYSTYISERSKWAESPAFFLDCADFFYKNDDNIHGRRILTNLAEMRVEDAAMLRVLAWRLRQADELAVAAVVLRRVAKLRPEEPQSLRDLALVLADHGQATGSTPHLEEAMQLLLNCAIGNWQRHRETICIFALEELNALVALIEKKEWKPGTKPKIPDYDKRLHENLDTDLRIIMSWDADATDIDLHVLEPGGEEAFFGNNRTGQGGLVSQDITDGYGPEEYLMRVAPIGSYTLKTNYFASRQQTVVGPATITATVFTNWGRPNEKRETLTIRLDKPKEKIEIGTIQFGNGEVSSEENNLKIGMTRDQVIEALGKPIDPAANPLVYTVGAKTLKILFDDSNKLTRVTEILPGGSETIVLQ
ncbi:MAG: VIT domain-containing protein [Verrucomicrobiota bacterium]